MSKNDNAAQRARHGTRAGGSRSLRMIAAITAGVLGFGVVYGVTNLELLQHSLNANTQDISGLVGLPSGTGDGTSTSAADALPTDPDAGNDINFLLVGSDSRSGKNGAIGGKVSEGMRSDTTIIMHVSADRSRVDLLSVPRDMRVRVSDCKMFDGSIKKGWTGKFNIAFANGGINGNEAEAAACTMRTLQDLTGIAFDHYAVVDFAGFENMINAVDGVPMCVPEAIKDTRSKLNIKAGAQVLSGKTALAYARVRHIGDGTDLGRISRQQELLNNLAKKVLGMNMLTSVPQLTLLLKSASESMTMDPDLASLSYLAGLGYSMRNIDQKNINFLTVPWKYAGDKSGDVLPTDEAAVVYKRIKHDIPMDGGTTESVKPSASATPDATTGSSSTPSTKPTTKPTTKPATTPSTTPTPERLTEDEILAECATD